MSTLLGVTCRAYGAEVMGFLSCVLCIYSMCDLIAYPLVCYTAAPLAAFIYIHDIYQVSGSVAVIMVVAHDRHS